ncbi:MAG: PEP-CTERM sorting domain-containing protein [Verrucomicrobiales bacterium]|nr:PEP-CTERM sorting domain-containing protein [Verrucomicrobiales bacterium]
MDIPTFPTGQIVALLGGSGPASDEHTAPVSIPLGATRKVIFEREVVQGSSGGDSLFINAGGDQGRLAIHADVASDLKATITYDNGGVAEGIGLNLSDPQHPNLFLLGASNDQVTDWSLTLFDGINSWTETQTTTPPGGPWIGDIAFALAAFSDHGVILSSIDTVTVVIDPQTYGGDVNLHAIAVPEPNMTVAVLGILGLGLIALRRRQPRKLKMSV